MRYDKNPPVCSSRAARGFLPGNKKHCGLSLSKKLNIKIEHAAFVVCLIIMFLYGILRLIIMDEGDWVIEY